MASLTRWTWVGVSSRSRWWTAKPGVLPTIGLQRVGHDWAIELNWWLCWVFAVAWISLCSELGLLSIAECRLLTVVAPPVAERRLYCTAFSSCITWAQQFWLPGSREQAQQLWCTGLVALWHVGSSQIRDWTHVSCIGRWILTTEPPGKPRILVWYAPCCHLLSQGLEGTPQPADTSPQGPATCLGCSAQSLRTPVPLWAWGKLSEFHSSLPVSSCSA